MENSNVGQKRGQIAVLALDAADYELIQRFNCENIMLDHFSPLETEAWSGDTPSTKEVWPTVATGLTPDEHGLVLLSDGSLDPTWDDESLAVASWIAQYTLPSGIRKRIGGYLHNQSGTTQSLPKTDADHVFEEAYQWVGITSASHVAQIHDYWSRIQSGDLTEDQLYKNILKLTLNEFQWLATNRGLIGAHAHVLDVCGHTYAKDEGSIQRYYEEIDALVGWLRKACDELVILSDHGMQVSFLDDDSPGQHSMRAMVAATDGISTPLPESIYDVHDWLLEQSVPKRVDRDTTMDASEDQLRALGYI